MKRMAKWQFSECRDQIKDWLDSIESGQLQNLDNLPDFPGVHPSNLLEEAVRVAASGGQLLLLQQLLARPDITSNAAQKCFRAALRAGHLSIVSYLLPLVGVDFLAGNPSLLRSVAQAGHIEIVRILLEVPGVAWESKTANAALVLACQGGHLPVVELLLQLPGVDPTHHENLPFRAACASGNLMLVELFLGMPQVNPVDKQEDAILSACRKGHVEVVRRLLSLGRFAECLKNRSALQVAIQSGNVDLVKCLLEDDLGANSLHSSHLLEALEHNQQELIDLFLPNPQCASQRVMQWIVGHNRLDYVERLLQVKWFQRWIHDLVTLAAGLGHVTMMQMLMNARKKKHYRFSVFAAIDHGQAEALKLLMEHANPPYPEHIYKWVSHRAFFQPNPAVLDHLFPNPYNYLFQSGLKEVSSYHHYNKEFPAWLHRDPRLDPDDFTAHYKYTKGFRTVLRAALIVRGNHIFQQMSQYGVDCPQFLVDQIASYLMLPGQAQDLRRFRGMLDRLRMCSTNNCITSSS